MASGSRAAMITAWVLGRGRYKSQGQGNRAEVVELVIWQAHQGGLCCTTLPPLQSTQDSDPDHSGQRSLGARLLSTPTPCLLRGTEARLQAEQKRPAMKTTGKAGLPVSSGLPGSFRTSLHFLSPFGHFCFGHIQASSYPDSCAHLPFPSKPLHLFSTCPCN